MDEHMLDDEEDIAQVKKMTREMKVGDVVASPSGGYYFLVADATEEELGIFSMVRAHYLLEAGRVNFLQSNNDRFILISTIFRRHDEVL